MSDLIAVPKRKVDRIAKKLTAAKAENEALRARVAELEEFVSDTATACQRSLDPDWVPDWVHDALSPISDRCRTLLGDDPDEYESAWLLRKQAEAVEGWANDQHLPPNEDLTELGWHAKRIYGRAKDYAQRLRQQADEAERAGGEK
jgi:cell division septum initiation protein DivIVA